VITDLAATSGSELAPADVCIVGAGPAGQVLASELAGTNKRVVVLESGNLSFDAKAIALNDGEVDSSHHSPRALMKGRRRQVGGTTNLWVYGSTGDDGRHRARMLIPREIDFEDRGLSGAGAWPFGRSALDPYYERARALLGLEGASFEPDAWRTNGSTFDFDDSSMLTHIVCHHAASDVFSGNVADQFRGLREVELVLNATVASINRDNDRMGEAVVVRPDGTRLSLKARVFVVATGGVENARLLLLSDLPNGSRSNVGHYLMDHPEFDIGVLHPASRTAFEQMNFYDLRWTGDRLVSGQIALSSDAVTTQGLLDMCFVLVAQRKGYGTKAGVELKKLSAAKRARNLSGVTRAAGAAAVRPREAVAAIRNRLAGDEYSEFRGGWSVDSSRRFGVFEVFAVAEQSPTSSNRISLSDRRDGFGIPRAHMHWRWQEEDLERIRRAGHILEAELQRAGAGRYESLIGRDGAIDVHWQGIHHPMGTTRMSISPEHGVVDANCLVHGTTNLYVTGTSVFPTGLGYSNPTFTVVALVIRLADHLRTKLT
jgi:choline dehydrogenase-like flavoprotein